MQGARWLRVVVFLAAASLFLSVRGWGQITNGSFRGTVTDESGAVIPGATVKLASAVSGASRETTSGTQGEYLFPSVEPGVYNFTVSYQGFQTLLNTGVILQVGQQATLDFTLKPGQVVQEVGVTAQAPLLNTTNATVGTVVDRDKISQLPLNGRQFTQLILLTPGAAPQNTGLQNFYDVSTYLGAVSPAVNGTRSDMNNFTIDGVENNELYFNFVALSPPPDALQEFKVESDMSSGAFGRGAGANVNVVTRSGTNQLHGNVWEFLRNDKFDAANFFSNATGQPKSAFRQNQYGFALGGPVIKHKLYGFGWWEGFRKSLASSILGTVPTAAQLNGDLSAFPQIYNPFTTQQTGTDAQGNPIFTRDAFAGNQIPTNLIDPTAKNIAALMLPAPNTSLGGSNYINTQSLTTDTDQFGIRMDTTLPYNTGFFGRYSYSNGRVLMPTLLPVLPNIMRNRMQQAVIGLSRSMSPTSVLDFHMQYLRTSLLYYNPAPASVDFLTNNGLLKDFPPPQGIPPFMPGMCTSDNFCFGNQTWGPIAPINNWEYNGSYTKILGQHTLSVGGSLIRTYFYENYNYGNAGFDSLPTSDPQNQANTGSGLASFLLGVPSNANQFAGSYEFSATGNYYGAYFNDEWRATPKLTVTMGVRYDYASPFHETRGRLASLDWDKSTPTNTVWLTEVKNAITGDPALAPNGIYYPDRNNWSPRVAVAYRVKNDWVVRSGYGMYYDFNQGNIQDQQDTVGMWPWGAGDFVGNLNLPSAANPTPTRLLGTGIFPPFVFPTTPPYAPGFVANRHNRTPYVQTWNLAIDKSFGNNWLVSATYIGSKGTHIPIEFPVNVANQPGPGDLAPRQRLPQFAPLTIDGNWANTSYNAGQLKVEKRTTKGLAFLMSYTYSKSFDLSSTVHGSAQPYNGVQDPMHFMGSRGPSDFDLTHNLVTSVVYDLPIGEGKRFWSTRGKVSRYVLGGWQVTGIVTSNSGFPYTLNVPWDNANIGNYAQRPTQIGPLLPPGFKQTPDHWFDINAVTVIPYTFGTMGRNTMRQDGFQNVDFGLFKRTRLTESMSLDFRSEYFNSFNHPNFAAPNTFYNSPTFGQVSALQGQPREIQFGLKLTF